MYKSVASHQMTFEDFNESCGMKLSRTDEWYRLASRIDWEAAEAIYRQNFPSRRGHPAFSVRMALGALIIQKRMGLSDRGLVKAIAENPYYQYFIGLQAFSAECPFTATSLVKFRKRITAEMLSVVNERLLENVGSTPEHAKERRDRPDEPNGNAGTMILDATCSPSRIRYPQDFSLLNEAREKTDAMIDSLHSQLDGKGKRPRTYRRVLRKAYLAMAKAKRRTAKRTRALVRRLLCALRRNLAFVDAYLSRGGRLAQRQSRDLATIRELYGQQKAMFDSRTHRAENRIVSIAQPYVRPVVRGKAKAPVEFGAKYDVSIDEKGHARLEKLTFDPYNECGVLPDALEKYKARTGHYPRRVLVDRIYRTKANREFCESRGIRMSGRKAGRPARSDKAEERELRRDDRDRNEVERFFSREKDSCGAALIVTRLAETTLASIALSVLVANLFGIPIGDAFFVLYLADGPEPSGTCHFCDFLEE